MGFSKNLTPDKQKRCVLRVWTPYRFCKRGFMKGLDVALIEEKLGYTFQNKQYLEQAFVHSSYAKLENIRDNERMEFFGDAILDAIVSEYIYEKYPNYDAGQLSKVRSVVVSSEGLKPVVDELGIVDNLLVVDGSKIRSLSRKIAANLYEAVLCSIYLDGGMEAARQFVFRTLKSRMDDVKQNLKKDYKTTVQEYCQEKKLSIEYVEEGRNGPDNNPTFHYSLWIDGKKVSNGSGSSKKNAEQDAACELVNKWRLN